MEGATEALAASRRGHDPPVGRAISTLAGAPVGWGQSLDNLTRLVEAEIPF